MVRSDWGIVFAVVGIATLFGSVGYGLNRQAFYEQEAQDRGANYAARAANQIEQSCLGIAPPQKTKCLKVAAPEYRLKIRDNQREQDDLAAQQTSALWTKIMGVVAVFGTALSAIGVALVWTAFIETKRTNLIAMRENARNTLRAVQSGYETSKALSIAKRNAAIAMKQVKISEDTAQRQLRAYLAFQVEEKEPPSLTAEGQIIIPYGIINYGKTPALKCDAQSSYAIKREKFDWSGEKIERDREKTTVIHPAAGILQRFVSTFTVSQDHINCINAGTMVAYVRGVVYYEDVFGKPHCSQICLVINSIKDNIPDARISQLGQIAT